MDHMVIVWAALLVAFLVLEAATVQLTSIWFAAGSLVGLAAALLQVKLWLQILLFAVVSGALLALIYPMVKRKLNAKVVPTNADRAIGQMAVVTQTIDNLKATGAVKLAGTTWTARSADDTAIDEGETVKVLRIEGVKLIVQYEKIV